MVRYGLLWRILGRAGEETALEAWVARRRRPWPGMMKLGAAPKVADKERCSIHVHALRRARTAVAFVSSVLRMGGSGI